MKPYHKFAYNGNLFVINIEDMESYLIDQATFQTLENIELEPHRFMKVNTEEQLKKIGLLSNCMEKEKKNTFYDSTFGGVNSSPFSFQLGLLAIIQAKIYQSFPHYKVKHGIDDLLRYFISFAQGKTLGQVDST